MSTDLSMPRADLDRYDDAGELGGFGCVWVYYKIVYEVLGAGYMPSI